MAPSAWLRGETPRVSPLRGPRILLGRVGWFRGAIMAPAAFGFTGKRPVFPASRASHPCSVSEVSAAGPSTARR
jgi:hypothetical protein